MLSELDVKKKKNVAKLNKAVVGVLLNVLNNSSIGMFQCSRMEVFYNLF